MELVLNFFVNNEWLKKLHRAFEKVKKTLPWKTLRGFVEINSFSLCSNLKF